MLSIYFNWFLLGDLALYVCLERYFRKRTRPHSCVQLSYAPETGAFLEVKWDVQVNNVRGLKLKMFTVVIDRIVLLGVG